MKNKKYLLLAALCLSTFLSLMITASTFAEDITTTDCNTHPTSETCILNKAVLEDIYQCYKNGGVNNNISNFDDYTSVFNKNKSFGLPAKFTTTGYLWNKSDQGEAINCVTIANGSRDYSGINKSDFTYNGEKISINTSDTASPETKKKFLAGFGYAPENTTKSEECFYIYYYRYWDHIDDAEVMGSHEAADYTYCPTLASDGNTISKLTKEENSTVSGQGWECQHWGTHCYVYVESVNNEDGYVRIQKGYAGLVGCWSLLGCAREKVFFKGVTWNTFKSNLNQALDNLVPGRQGDYDPGDYITTNFKDLSIHTESHSSVTTSYKLTDKSGERGIYSISAESLKYSNLKFSNEQAIELYESYIKNVYASDKHITYPETEASFEILNGDERYKPTAWVDTEGKHTCAYVLLDDDASKNKVYGLDSNSHFNGTSSGLMDRDKVFQKLESILGANTCASKVDNFDSSIKVEIDPGEIAEAQEGLGTEESHDSEFLAACKEKLDLGWLICPVLDAVSNAADGIKSMVDEAF